MTCDRNPDESAIHDVSHCVAGCSSMHEKPRPLCTVRTAPAAIKTTLVDAVHGQKPLRSTKAARTAARKNGRPPIASFHPASADVAKRAEILERHNGYTPRPENELGRDPVGNAGQSPTTHMAADGGLAAARRTMSQPASYKPRAVVADYPTTPHMHARRRGVHTLPRAPSKWEARPSRWRRARTLPNKGGGPLEKLFSHSRR